MPAIQLQSNVEVEDTKALVKKLSKFSSEVLGKPENLILASFTHNETLSWEGTFDPAFLLTVVDLGTFTPERNPTIVAEYTKFLKENLGVNEKRGYVLLTDPGRDFVGYMGTTATKFLSK